MSSSPICLLGSEESHHRFRQTNQGLNHTERSQLSTFLNPSNYRCPLFETLDNPMDPTRRISCKIVLLGNSGVGKTSLVTRWTTGKCIADVNPTIGANHQHKSVVIDNNDVDLFLWDTAGQEQFHALAPLYAHSAAGGLIVASILDLDSIKGIQTWLDLVNRSCDRTPPCLLLVNKMDKSENAVLTAEEIKSEYAGLFNAVFFVSAVTGEGVAAAFDMIGELGFKFNAGATTSSRKVSISEPRENSCC
jgi:small GTP-binding protein